MKCDETDLRLHVRPNDLDSLGHVNNAVAMEYLETGRWHWLACNGLRRDNSILPVVSHAELIYRKELSVAEVRIRTWLQPDDLSRLTDTVDTYQLVFCQNIRNEAALDADPAIEARIKIAFVDARTRMLRTAQDFLAAATTSAAGRSG
jgi:acyl-CoA thioester hydrolase